ncbi:NAD(P)H-dependent oxidoreductase [Microbaculum marinum]|uniref:NAD(P)H-dependent oxidoreductase n=1 Tax=Microbaculum marinum TaxID=1764581 RepID=A0AAW9RLY6_9HYPH
MDQRTGEVSVATPALRVLLILAHPRGSASLCGAMLDAYSRGARKAGCEVRELELARTRFDRDVTTPSPRDQVLEADLVAAKTAIEWADHIVFVYPTWWGTYPALLKAFLDRILVPGWAFEDISGGTGFEGLLDGRTAELITTMDTPGPVYSFLYRAPGRHAMAAATLGFCGIAVTRHTRFGPVKGSTEQQRIRWIDEAERLGGRLANGPRSRLQRLWQHVRPWLSALRLQFYPMTFLAFWLGALTAAAGGGIDPVRFWLGYAVLFAIEAATVFSNDLLDAGSDSRNQNWGPFNGGSRVLQGGILTAGSLLRGARLALTVAIGLTIVLTATAAQPAVLGLFFAASALLALGYTMPPLRLSYRTLGEVDVAVTHSFLAILAGHLFQNGAIGDPVPWILGAPLFLSILPSIILSGVPDRDADMAVGKRTIAVRFGIRGAFAVSAGLALAALIAMVAVEALVRPGTYGWVVPVLVAVHGLVLARECRRQWRRPADARRIDVTMIVALTYLMWFCVVPLWTVSG